MESCSLLFLLNPNKKSVARANSSVGVRPISASKKHDPT